MVVVAVFGLWQDMDAVYSLEFCRSFCHFPCLGVGSCIPENLGANFKGPSTPAFWLLSCVGSGEAVGFDASFHVAVVLFRCCMVQR